MDVISLYIYCILASSLYTLFNLYNNSWFTFNVSIMHLLHLLSAHFKQSCSENTGAYKPVRFPAPFVITICWLSCFVFSQYVLISVDMYTVPVLFPCVMTINWLNLNLKLRDQGQRRQEKDPKGPSSNRPFNRRGRGRGSGQGQK